MLHNCLFMEDIFKMHILIMIWSPAGIVCIICNERTRVCWWGLFWLIGQHSSYPLQLFINYLQPVLNSAVYVYIRWSKGTRVCSGSLASIRPTQLGALTCQRLLLLPNNYKYVKYQISTPKLAGLQLKFWDGLFLFL